MLQEAYDYLLRDKPTLSKKDWERRCSFRIGTVSKNFTWWSWSTKNLNAIESFEWLHARVFEQWQRVMGTHFVARTIETEVRCRIGALANVCCGSRLENGSARMQRCFPLPPFSTTNDKKFTETYRGPAFELALLLPTLQYFLETTCGKALEHEVHCFRHAVEICRQYHRLLARDGFPLSPLRCLQEAHQQLTTETCGQSFAKPKHHHRFHIPLQVKKMHLGHFFIGWFRLFSFFPCLQKINQHWGNVWLRQCMDTTKACEAKHNEYTTFLASRFQQFSRGHSGGVCKFILPRLLHMQVASESQRFVAKIGWWGARLHRSAS